VTRALRERERVEQRVLGALRCVDATTLTPIEQPITVEGDGVRLLPNQRGLHVIREWTPLAAHAAAFEAPPPEPPVGGLSLALTLRDPSGGYLPRRVRIALPRDPSPERAAEPDSLFRPVDVLMFPSPSAPVGANWVELRVTVAEAASGDALGGALLRVVSEGQVLARGLTDWRGEALVPVAGVPVTTWSTEPEAVVVTEIVATLEAVFDPASGRRTRAAAVRAGQAPAVPPIVDADALDAARAELPRAARALLLAAGRSIHVAITVAVS
jgi:hypothetical protein